MAKGCDQAFDDPIDLPCGRRLVTLKDAANFIVKLPKAEQNAEEWQTAGRMLIRAAEGRDFSDACPYRDAAGDIPQRNALVQP
jgi:hypothetical protein